MIWIAPSEKGTDNAALERRLWDAADSSARRSAKCEVRVPKSSQFDIRPSTFAPALHPRRRENRRNRTPLPPEPRRPGLEGEIKHGGNINSYYDDPYNATGRFDFVLANPPFNVNAVDTAN